MEYAKDGYSTHHVLEDLVLMNDDWQDESGLEFYVGFDAEVEVDDQGNPHIVWSMIRNEDGETFELGEYDGDDASLIRAFCYAHRAAFGHMFGAPGPREISAIYEKWHNKAMRGLELTDRELLQEQQKYEGLA